MEIILVICALINQRSKLLTTPQPRKIRRNRSEPAGAAAGPPAPSGNGAGTGSAAPAPVRPDWGCRAITHSAAPSPAERPSFGCAAGGCWCPEPCEVPTTATACEDGAAGCPAAGHGHVAAGASPGGGSDGLLLGDYRGCTFLLQRIQIQARDHFHARNKALPLPARSADETGAS